MFTMLVGEIDRVPGEGGQQDHKVATRFVSFVGPLIPFRSMCVTYEDFSRHGGTSTHSYGGEDVKLSLASIALGYVRVWSWVAAFVLPFALYWGKSVNASQFIPSAWAAGVGIASLVLPSLFTRGRVKRLRVVRRVTGLGCDPARRTDWHRNETLESLTAQLAEQRLPTSPEALLDRASSLSPQQAALVFTWAWYRGDGALREAAWQRCAQTAA